jgi:hypothetical protein
MVNPLKMDREYQIFSKGNSRIKKEKPRKPLSFQGFGAF